MPTTYDYFPDKVSDTYLTQFNIDEEDQLARIPNPSRPFTQGIKTSTITFSADSGHEQRRTKAQPKATFDLQWNLLTYPQKQTIQDFYMKVLNVTPFLWKHPLDKETKTIDGSDVVQAKEFLVRFDMDTFSAANKSHSPFHRVGALFELQVKLVQVWG